jgi:hypothetical protein
MDDNPEQGYSPVLDEHDFKSVSFSRDEAGQPTLSLCFAPAIPGRFQNARRLRALCPQQMRLHFNAQYVERASTRPHP